jgi:hypothetical protein
VIECVRKLSCSTAKRRPRAWIDRIEQSLTHIEPSLTGLVDD